MLEISGVISIERASSITNTVVNRVNFGSSSLGQVWLASRPSVASSVRLVQMMSLILHKMC